MEQASEERQPTAALPQGCGPQKPKEPRNSKLPKNPKASRSQGAQYRTCSPYLRRELVALGSRFSPPVLHAWGRERPREGTPRSRRAQGRARHEAIEQGEASEGTEVATWKLPTGSGAQACTNPNIANALPGRPQC